MSRKAQFLALASSFGVVSILSYMQARKPKPMTSETQAQYNLLGSGNVDGQCYHNAVRAVMGYPM